MPTMFNAIFLLLTMGGEPECMVYATGSPCHDVTDVVQLCTHYEAPSDCLDAAGALFGATEEETTAARAIVTGCDDGASSDPWCDPYYDTCDNAIATEECVVWAGPDEQDDCALAAFAGSGDAAGWLCVYLI